MYEISVRVPGYDVVSSRPVLNVDLNRRYPIHVQGDTEVVFVVRKKGAEKPKNAST